MKKKKMWTFIQSILICMLSIHQASASFSGTGGFHGHWGGDYNGNIEGDNCGDVTGDIKGDYKADIDGDIKADINGDHGNNNADNAENADNGQNGNNNGSDDPNGGRKFKFAILPIPYFNYDRGRQILNLCQTNLKEEAIKKGAPVELLSDECLEGYKVTEFRNTEWGLGAALVFAYSSASVFSSIFGGAIGILPVKGSFMKVDRYAPTKAAIYEMRGMKIPYKAEDLDSWQVGDSLTYMSSGSILTFATVTTAANFIFTGAGYLAKGDWMVEVQKIDKTKVIVKITKSKLKSFSVAAGTLVSELSLAEFRNTDQSFAWGLDLSDPTAVKVYEDLIRGNLLPAQEMIKGGDIRAVYPISKEFVFTKMHRRRMYAGIPYIVTKTWDKGRMFKDSQTFLFENNEKIDADYSIYFKSNFRKSINGYFHKHIALDKSFTAAKMVSTIEKKGSVEDYYGELRWAYSNDHAKYSQFQKALYSLYSFTGMKEHLMVQVPKYKNLGYAGISVTVRIPKEGVEKLIALAKEQGDVLTKKLMTIYHTEKSQPHLKLIDLSGERGEEGEKNEVLTKNMFLDSSTQLKNNLLDMDRDRDKNKLFVEHFANFGRNMIDNPYMLKSIIKLIPESVEFKYNVEGEKFAAFKETIDVRMIE